MPTKLPSGLVIWNVTPHDLHFWCEKEGVVVTAPSDDVVNALPVTEDIERTKEYKFVSVTFEELEEGRKILQRIKKNNPKAVIVGSIIAAQAYPGEVVASVPYKPSRYSKQQRLVKSDRFTTFKRSSKHG